MEMGAVARRPTVHSIPSLLSKFTAISFQDNLCIDGGARSQEFRERIMTGPDSLGTKPKSKKISGANERTNGLTYTKLRTKNKKKNQGAPVHLAVTLYCTDDVKRERKWE